jgi:hypothetical protein
MEEKTWEEFISAGMIWWINRSLHLFGWAIAYTKDDDGKVIGVNPVKCRFRGFSEKDESDGFIAVTKYISENIDAITKDSSS